MKCKYLRNFSYKTRKFLNKICQLRFSQDELISLPFISTWRLISKHLKVQVSLFTCFHLNIEMCILCNMLYMFTIDLMICKLHRPAFHERLQFTTLPYSTWIFCITVQRLTTSALRAFNQFNALFAYTRSTEYLFFFINEHQTT